MYIVHYVPERTIEREKGVGERELEPQRKRGILEERKIGRKRERGVGERDRGSH